MNYLQDRLRLRDQQLKHVNKIINSEDLENNERLVGKDHTIASEIVHTMTRPPTTPSTTSNQQVFFTPRAHRVSYHLIWFHLKYH